LTRFESFRERSQNGAPPEMEGGNLRLATESFATNQTHKKRFAAVYLESDAA